MAAIRASTGDYGSTADKRVVVEERATEVRAELKQAKGAAKADAEPNVLLARRRSALLGAAGQQVRQSLHHARAQ